MRLNKKLYEKDEKILPLKSSKILQENEIDLVINWLKNNNNDNIKFENISFELLYRASRDGDSSSTFHKLCDGKGPTIIFIKNEDDFRFVGYTSKKWKCCNESESDSSSFLFSLTNKEKYLLKNTNDKNAIYHCENNSLGFGDGGCDLYVGNNCFTNKNFKCYSYSYQFDNKKMYNEKESFYIKDYKVYLVMFK